MKGKKGREEGRRRKGKERRGEITQLIESTVNTRIYCYAYHIIRNIISSARLLILGKTLTGVLDLEKNTIG